MKNSTMSKVNYHIDKAKLAIIDEMIDEKKAEIESLEAELKSLLGEILKEVLE